MRREAHAAAQTGVLYFRLASIENVTSLYFQALSKSSKLMRLSSASVSWSRGG